jgi:hypothetical protein
MTRTMSRIAPDIPELQHVPEAARSLVYVSALNGAIRSPLTWLTGAIVFAIAAGLGATGGSALFGSAGAILGTAVGASAAGWCFFKVILPWRARRLLPLAAEHADSTLIDRVRDADERVKRMVDAYKQRETRDADDTTDRRRREKAP